MKQLRISYKKMGIRLEIIRQVPGNWDELTVSQFLLVARLYTQELSETDFITKFFSLPKVNFDAYYLYHLTELLSFIGDCRFRMNRFLIPSVDKCYLAPADKLRGITFEHFMHIDTAFNRYVRDPNNIDLDTLFALLYLKEGESLVLPAEGRKTLFSHRKLLNLPKRLQEVAKIDTHIKYAVFLNYLFIKRWLSQAFPYLFPMDDSEQEADAKKQAKAPSVNWLDVFDAFVGEDVANMEKYQQMTALTAFRLLNKRIKEAQKAKK